MMPSPTDAVNKLTTIFLVVGQSFCYTMVRILSGPTPLSLTTENTALATSSIDIGTIDNWC